MHRSREPGNPCQFRACKPGVGRSARTLQGRSIKTSAGHVALSSQREASQQGCSRVREVWNQTSRPRAGPRRSRTHSSPGRLLLGFVLPREGDACALLQARCKHSTLKKPKPRNLTHIVRLTRDPRNHAFGLQRPRAMGTSFSRINPSTPSLCVSSEKHDRFRLSSTALRKLAFARSESTRQRTPSRAFLQPPICRSLGR